MEAIRNTVRKNPGLKAAAAVAWAVPVVAVAIAVPNATASEAPPAPPVVCSAYQQDNGEYIVDVANNLVRINYRVAPDIYEINIRYSDGTTQSFGTNYGTAPTRGSLTWSIPLRAEPTWIQVHSFNTHYGETC